MNTDLRQTEEANKRTKMEEQMDDSFSLHYLNEGDSTVLGCKDENNIIFLLKGKVRVHTSKNNHEVLASNYMFNISKIYAPYPAEALEASMYVQLKTSSIKPYIIQPILRRIIAKNSIQYSQIEGLRLGKMMSMFLTNIIVLKKSNFTSSDLYDLKKEEFLYYVREEYSEIDLLRFFQPSLSNQSDFRINVLTKYRNSGTVKELAADCFMTTKTLTRYFKKEFNTTPHRWLIEQKTASLNSYFMKKGMPIEDILTNYGFASVAELIRFCTRYKLENVLAMIKILQK